MKQVIRKLYVRWKTFRDPDYCRKQRLKRGKELWNLITASIETNPTISSTQAQVMYSRIKSLTKDEKEILHEYINKRNSDLRRKKSVQNGEKIWNDLEAYLKDLGVSYNDEVIFSFFEREIKKLSLTDLADLSIWLKKIRKDFETNFSEHDTATIRKMEEQQKAFYQHYLEIVEKAIKDMLH